MKMIKRELDKDNEKVLTVCLMLGVMKKRSLWLLNKLAA
jgi:hypothetical protein